MSAQTNSEILENLRKKLEKLVASPFWVHIGYGTSVVFVAIARSRKLGANSSKQPEEWYCDFAKAIAKKYGASFDSTIEEEGNLVYDSFSWDIQKLGPEKLIEVGVAAIKDFMAGVSAAGQINLEQAVNALKLSAALQAAAIPDSNAKRRDRGDNL